MSQRLYPETHMRESAWITQFVLNRIVPDEDSKVFLEDIFQAYKTYVRANFHQNTELTIDGFGRLFPKVFKRRSIYQDGRVLKGVIGVKIA